mmetsp:Transcript_19940/g.45011  ORF Transcript_19940/g.45011 Transcript_19940/m.45011 type:complete len:97 (+) Transcript_19940:619-909(+)
MRNLQDGQKKQWDEDDVPTDEVMNKVEGLHKLASCQQAKLAHGSNCIVSCQPIPNAVTILNEDCRNSGHQTDTNHNSNRPTDRIWHEMLHHGKEPP